MAAQDLIISRRSPAGTSSYLDSDPSTGEPSGPDGAAVLFATLRNRWLLLVVIGVVSGGLASLAAWQFSRKTAVVKAAIIYTGLPNASANSAFDPLGAATGAEMVTSVKVLKQLCDRRGLNIPAVRMAEYVTTSVSRSSSLINLSIAWADVDEAIEILNELTVVFIDEMAAQRKAILKQNLEHLEMTLLQAKGRVDEARSQISELEIKQRDELNKGGQTSERYRNMLSQAASAKLRVDSSQSERTAKLAQIKQVKASVAATLSKQHELEERVKTDLLNQVRAVLVKARDAAGPASSQQINQTIASVTQLVQSPKAAKDFAQWQQKLVEILQNTSNGLSNDNRKKLDEAFAAIQRDHDSEFKEADAQRHRQEDKLEEMQLTLIQVEQQFLANEQQHKSYEDQAKSLEEQITGVSANQMDETHHLLEEAEKQQDSLTVQRDAIRQLSEGRIKEWTVTVPASLATATTDSNRTKLFILVFGVCCFGLSAPLFVAEWHAQSGSPQVQMARSLRVPVLAERILEHFSPHARTSGSAAELGADYTEVLRMLTLRIQQSCHRPGSVILFSSLDAKFSASPLMATVAECLAEREERVLLIDAVCPQRSLLSVLTALTPGAIAALPAPQKKSKRERTTPPPAIVPENQPTIASGLSEYLSEECEDLSELIQPTGCPGVDLIASGRRGFSREAMASSCLTELLNTCRKNYTMVLVHGPSVDCAADLQMLTARADGIVLAATKESGKDPRAREFVQDLLDLGASYRFSRLTGDLQAHILSSPLLASSGTILIATIVIITAVLLALPLVVLAIECWFSLLPLRRQLLREEPTLSFRIAVVIPAHDEADRIADAVLRIKAQVPEDTRIVVIADNCSDATATNALAAGAVVWQRDDPERRGKGYALNFAWEHLADSPPDVVVCIDADCEPDPDCIATVARLAYERRRPVQAGYSMFAPPGAGGLARVSSLAVYVKNVVRPRGLQWLRLPCLLTGSGMAFPWEALSLVRHEDAHLVEDMRASTDFAIAGFAPMPCMEVGVSSPLPAKRSGFISQRTRWEHGHMRTILSQVPRLVAKFLLTGSLSLLILALELAVPPLSLLVGVTIVGELALLGFALATANWLPLIGLSSALAAAALGIALVWARGGQEILPAKMIAAQIPRYISVKAPLYLRFLARPQTDWVRTERARPLAVSPDGIPSPHARNFGSADSQTPKADA